MSRHRNLRNIEDDLYHDYEEEEYEEEEELDQQEPSLEAYIANLALDDLQLAQLYSGLDMVKNILPQCSFSDSEIADALRFYKYDVEKTVDWLLDKAHTPKRPAQPGGSAVSTRPMATQQRPRVATAVPQARPNSIAQPGTRNPVAGRPSRPSNESSVTGRPARPVRPAQSQQSNVNQPRPTRPSIPPSVPSVPPSTLPSIPPVVQVRPVMNIASSRPLQPAAQALSTDAFAFDTPSPDDIVLAARVGGSRSQATSVSSSSSISILPSAPSPLPSSSVATPTPTTTTTPTQSTLRKKTSLSKSALASKGQGGLSQFEVDITSFGFDAPVLSTEPVVNLEASSTSESSSSSSKSKATKAKFDIEQEIAKRGGGKEAINIVIIGHVDAGKSTLTGHLLYLLGNVSDKVIKKYQREAEKIGKGSFAFAWVLDETEEERQRGVTMDVGTTYFETPSKQVTVLDTPGHRDFIPNMISGAAQADAAVLVVDSNTGEFEAGFDGNGQTKEHALLARSLGVAQIIIVINKLDMLNWSRDRFDEIVAKLTVFLRQAGFKDKGLSFVPCSGLSGENLTQHIDANCALYQWYTGNTLLQQIDLFTVPPRPFDRPLRLSITDVFRTSHSSRVFVTGKVESGFVQVSYKVRVVPSSQIASVDVIEVKGSQTTWAVAGDPVSLGLSGIDEGQLSVGQVLCLASGPPATVADTIVAQIVVFDTDVVIINGASVIFYRGSLNEPATITKLISLINKTTGEVIKNKPRALAKNASAYVEIRFARPICVEVYKEFKDLGRFMLRSNGKTIAAGVITETRSSSATKAE